MWQNSREEKREPHHFMSFFRELKRRNVFRVGAAYAVTAWVLLQVLEHRQRNRSPEDPTIADAIEELEETARLYLLLHGRDASLQIEIGKASCRERE